MNQAILIGRISNDLDLKYLPNGQNCKINFNLAVNGVKRQDGSQETDFIPVEIWNKAAENLVKFQTKGSKIAVRGRISVDNYTDQQEEQARKEEEAKQQNKIGERIVFTYGSKCEFALTIDSVKLTSERNQFADPVKNVVEISYTVENISMEELDFFMDNQAEFYDAEGFKCSSYPNSTGEGTYDIAKGKKATGKEFIGITNSDATYLEMNIGGTEYKWSL